MRTLRLMGRWLIGLVFLSVPAYASVEAPLKLTDATFTDNVVDRQPGNRLSVYSLSGQEEKPRLWFWFRLECGDACIREPGLVPEIPIYVKWAYQQEKTFEVKDTVSLTVRGVTWRAWTYKQNLEPGRWRVAIFTDEGAVCLAEQCEFTVEVTP